MNVKIIPSQFSEEEVMFLDDFYSIFKKYPFKIFDLLKIFKNNELSFKRDSTLIITISNLSSLTINDLLEFFNSFYKNNCISKVIYQKEFLIIHFNNQFVLDVLTDKTFYMYIDYYYYLLKITNEVYLLPDVIINNVSEKVELVFYYQNEYYIFKKDKSILPYPTYYIDLFMNLYEFKNRIHLKYYISDNMKKEELNKIFYNNNSFK